MIKVSKEDFSRFVKRFDACYERAGGGKLRMDTDRVRTLVRDQPDAARRFVEIYCRMADSQPGYLQPACVVAVALLAEFDDRTALEMVEKQATALNAWHHLAAMRGEPRGGAFAQPPSVAAPNTSASRSVASPRDAPDGRHTQVPAGVPAGEVDQSVSTSQPPGFRDLEELVDAVLRGAASPAEVEEWVRAQGMESPPTDGDMRMVRAIKRLVAAAEPFEDDVPERAFPLLAAAFLLASVPGVIRSRLAFRAGYAAWRCGEHKHADALLRAAVELFHREGDTVGALAALNYRCDSLKQMKRYHELDGVALDLIECATATGHRGWAALALRDRGVALAALGREGALDSIQKAVRLRRLLTDEEAREQSVVPLPDFLDALGTIARQLGNQAVSLNAFLELASLPGDQLDDSLRALALSDVGYTYMAAGDRDRAREYLLRAADLGATCGELDKATRWRLDAGALSGETAVESVESEPGAALPSVGDLSGAYLSIARARHLAEKRRFQEAYDLAVAVVAEAKRNNDNRLLLTALNVMGAAAGSIGRHDEAIETFRAAVQLADGTRTSDASLQLRYNLAHALIHAHKYTEAGSVLLAGIAYSRAALAMAEGTEFRKQVLAASRPVCDLYASLAAQADYHRNWVAAAEQARAQNLRAWLGAERQIRHTTRSARQQAAIGLRALRQVEVELEMRHHEGAIDAATLAALRHRRDGALRALDAELATCGLPPIPWTPDNNPFEEADELLGTAVSDGRTVLYLHAVPEGVCACAAWQGEAELKLQGAFISTGVEGLRTAFRRLGAASSRCSTRATAGRAPAGLKALEEMSADLRSQMNASLVAPLYATLEQRHPEDLLIVADAELAFLPWWALADALGTSALHLVPSLHVANFCLKTDRESRRSSLLVGDETATLNGAVVEVDTIEKLVRSRSDVRRHQDLCQLSGALRSCSHLHLAAHGVWNAKNPYLSGIVIGDSSRSRGTFVRYTDLRGGFFEDAAMDRWRVWTVGEVMTEAALDDCELVVLSACESAIAHDHAAGEMTGLPAAFLLAGARSVIGSVWPVHDGATTVLMHHFYHCWSGGAGSEPNASRALAAARRALQRTSRREALDILGDTSALPAALSTEASPDDLPFESPLFSDAFYCYGA